MIKGIREKE